MKPNHCTSVYSIAKLISESFAIPSLIVEIVSFQMVILQKKNNNFEKDFTE